MADSGDEEKSKRAEKYVARRKVKNGEATARRAQGLFSPFFTFHDVRLRFSLSEFRYLSTWNSTPENSHRISSIERDRKSKMKFETVQIS